MTEPASWESKRHLTAIGRPGLSMPARQALRDRLIRVEDSFFDYGSGKGQDVHRLSLMGHRASGWDPFFEPFQRPSPADTIMLSYVLNVIEKPSERRSTLEHAWSLTRRALVVATRLVWDERKLTGVAEQDGVRTSRSTFQHMFTTSELRNFVESVTGVRCVSPTPGVVYAFRHDSDRLTFLAQSSLPEFTWANPDDLTQALEEAIAFAHRHGRPPAFDEIPREVLPALAGLSSTQLNKIIREAVDAEEWSQGVRSTTLDVLLFLGVAIFHGRPRLNDIPQTMRLNIRAHFNSYREACQRADRLLLKLRDDTYVRGAMRNSVGKMTPTALYAHRRARDSMPVILRLYEHCGAIASGRPEGWNILKLNHEGRRVAWSHYPEFDREPHPRLAWTYGVEMASLHMSYRNYQDSPNRPLLHRKHEFLASDDPHYAKCERLSRAEVKAGLYADPSRIGLEDGWGDALTSCGVKLKGHRLVKDRQSD